MSSKEFDGSLYLVTNEEGVDRPLREIVEAAVEGGVTVVQLRDRADQKERIVKNAKKLLVFLRSRGVPLIINNFVDIAQHVGADGVHLGQRDMPVVEARRRLGGRAIIGLSVENMQQARLAHDLPVDYLGVSTVFGSRIKPHDSHWGEEGLADLRRNTDQYLVGIGGIKHHNVERVITAGADGVAVVSAIYAAEDPRQAAKDMLAKIEEARSANWQQTAELS